MERESRRYSSRSHHDLAILLRDYLQRNYPGVSWVVIVYDDVRGFENHAVYGTDYYSLYSHFGHNIVVGYRIKGQSNSPPENLENTFSKAYRKQEDCHRRWWETTCTLNAKRTVLATWKQLRRRGITPVMLFVIRNGINVHKADNANRGYIVSQKVTGGFATLLVIN